MRQMIRFVARLYPRRWRERYGEEFAALLEDTSPNAGAAWNVFTGAITMQIRTWNLGWIAGVSVACACVVFAVAFFAIPKTYVSSATLKVETQETPQAAWDFVNRILERVESRSSLTRILTSENLYKRERTRMTLEAVIKIMRQSTTILREAQEPGTFTVAFSYPDPRIAQEVTRRLTSDFIEENLRQAAEDRAPLTLEVLDATSLPTHPANSPALIAAAVSIPLGLFLFTALSLWRRRRLRAA